MKGSPPEYRDHSVKSLPERVAAMEVHIDVVKENVAEMKILLNEIHSVILQGKGAKWAIVSFVGVISSFIGVILHKYLPWFPKQ